MNPALSQALAHLLSDRFSQNTHLLHQHSHGESHHPAALPDAIAYVKTENELMNTVALCHQYRTPMVAFGAGTSVEGQVQALKGGVCIDFSLMNQILEINADDMNCVVEPGVTREQLNQALRDQGLFFPVDPGANATLGGMIATGASGTTTLLYGGMKHNTLALEAVLSNGPKITTGTAARKSSAGYNLTELLVGSEGTLALTSKARLKLYGIPEQTSAARVTFPSLQQAVNSVIEMIQCNLNLARMELLDQHALVAVNQYCKTEFATQPTLFLEFHGTTNSTQEQAKLAENICTAHKGSQFQYSMKEEHKRELWHARHNAYYAAIAKVHNGKGWVTDVCVPISKLAHCIEATQQDLQQAGLTIPIVGHVGDGNFHLLFSIPENDHKQLASAQQINKRLVARAHALGGTCTGEHGIGLGKRAYLIAEKGQNSVDLMATIKQALDPLNLLNPGKLFFEYTHLPGPVTHAR